MKNKLLFGIALFVVILMSYMSYSSALDSSDTTRLIRAINSLSNNVEFKSEYLEFKDWYLVNIWKLNL